MNSDEVNKLAADISGKCPLGTRVGIIQSIDIDTARVRFLVEGFAMINTGPLDRAFPMALHEAYRMFLADIRTALIGPAVTALIGPIEVTDFMVDRALKARMGAIAGLYRPETDGQTSRQITFEAMRAALRAALAPEA